MTNISAIAEEIAAATEFQDTPREITDDDYLRMAKFGLRRLYVDTGRAEDYDITKYSLSRGQTYWEDDLNANEIMYVELCAELRFYDIVRGDVNTMVSYTTDALSVSHGDKPFANLTATIAEKENDRRILFYKLVPYTILDN